MFVCVGLLVDDETRAQNFVILAGGVAASLSAFMTVTN